MNSNEIQHKNIFPKDAFLNDVLKCAVMVMNHYRVLWCILGDDTPEAIDTNRYVVPYCATKWRELGEALGMSPFQLNIINVDHPNSCEERCKAMLRKWVEYDSSATWGKLVDSVNTIHCKVPSSREGKQAYILIT